MTSSNRAGAATDTPMWAIIGLDQVLPNPHNPRKRFDQTKLRELAATIKIHGLLEPLVVCAYPGREGCFMLLDGERRLRACKLARLREVEVTVRPIPSNYLHSTVIALVANCTGEDLSPVEIAHSLDDVARGRPGSGRWSQADPARFTGISPSMVSYYLSLLELDQASQQRVVDRTVSVGDARAAVKATRAATRRRSGLRSPGQKTVTEPAWFTIKHPLAQIVAAMCNHHTRPMVPPSRIGCGQCWEKAIRDDNDWPQAGHRGPASAPSHPAIVAAA